MAEVLGRYERQGFRGQFGARLAGKIVCFACRRERPAAEVHLLAMHRLEGASDPSEEVAVAAVECPACKTRGTLTLSYGVGASAEDAMVLKAIADRRSDGPMRPGL